MNKKIVISVILIFLVTIGLIFGLILIQKNQNINEKAAPATNLIFNPSTLSIMRGQTFNVTSKLNSGTNAVTGVDILITYNPLVIQINQLTPTTSLTNFKIIKNQIDNTLGKARYIAYVTDKSLALSGNINLLTINGTILNLATAGTYQISYSNLSAIAAVSESQNALLDRSSVTVTVTVPTLTPTTVPTITPTKSPAPSPTSKPLPTKSPNPSPSPTPKVGDVSGDGHVNLIDIGIVVDVYDTFPLVNPRADIDKNGKVDIVDIGLIIDNYEGP